MTSVTNYALMWVLNLTNYHLSLTLLLIIEPESITIERIERKERISTILAITACVIFLLLIFASFIVQTRMGKNIPLDEISFLIFYAILFVSYLTNSRTLVRQVN